MLASPSLPPTRRVALWLLLLGAGLVMLLRRGRGARATTHPTVADAVCNANETLAQCGGVVWEALTCRNPTTCVDTVVTCVDWNMCDCCSAVPLHKCLLPTAGRAFDTDCSSPIDGREQCCSDASTHERTTSVETAIENALVAVVNATAALANALLPSPSEDLLQDIVDTGRSNPVQD
jgi:hypothetical protein